MGRLCESVNDDPNRIIPTTGSWKFSDKVHGYHFPFPDGFWCSALTYAAAAKTQTDFRFTVVSRQPHPTTLYTSNPSPPQSRVRCCQENHAATAANPCPDSSVSRCFDSDQRLAGGCREATVATPRFRIFCS
ncbi:hypothetical protein QVD17_16475 [Tagetes erecta]|uniref:Uncharacterized protein n=1 Tax=Tagetes erecta TaxID=13708 RepID=A0AAD8KXZ1_TARER|nr:hypothetical protein QVD17_16475 [Tagetes erecta]